MSGESADAETQLAHGVRRRGVAVRALLAAAQLPEILARLDERLVDVVEVAQVALVVGEVCAATGW